MDHVHGARAALTEKRQKQSGHLPPSQIESLLSGRSAEFIMQHVLERYLAPPPNPEDAQAHLIHRRRSLRFPEGPHSTDASHHLHFRTLYNCELNRTQRTGSAHGNKPFHTSSLTLTEFDALATTGLDPEHPELFHTLYAFEATTMSKLEEKMKDKESKLRPFKEDMNHRGINLHVFHVLLHSRQIAPEQLAKMVNAPIPPDTHLLALPLISSVDRVVRRTAKELKVKLS
jgi:hypothetical protein